MNKRLILLPLEFDRAEVDDDYFAMKFKDKLKLKVNKKDESDGFNIEYSYLNVVDFAI
jgi:hypothetical protein